MRCRCGGAGMVAVCLFARDSLGYGVGWKYTFGGLCIERSCNQVRHAVCLYFDSLCLCVYRCGWCWSCARVDL